MSSSASGGGNIAALLPAELCDGEESVEEETAEELLQDAKNAFGEIFSVKAPRDALAGIFSGMKCVVSGVMLGLAGAVMQPYEGMRDAGPMGCFRGMALGMCTGLFFAITGLCTGMFQAVRGVVATPLAVCMVRKGWRWDCEKGTWAEPERYSLPAEAANVLADADEDDAEDPHCTPSTSSRAPRPLRHVADTFYYELLSVSPSASEREIRQAYFSLSRQWHPDKTSDPTAKVRFQEISEAYQVLSDKERRRAYDVQGRPGAGESFIDAHVFFNVLFGADLLEPFVGQLRLGEVFDTDLFSGEDSGGAATSSEDDLGQCAKDAEKATRQLRRQVQLAVGLSQRLEPFVDGDVSSFVSEARSEARGIMQRDASLDRFLSEIGWVYRNRGELYLARLRSPLGALGFQAVCVRLRCGGREARQKATTAKLAVRSFMELRKIVQEVDSKEAEEGAEAASSEPPSGRSKSTEPPADSGDDEAEEEISESLTKALPTFMETFWSLTAHDITGTLDKVVERVLSDESVSIVVRRSRAEALQELGTVFVEEAEAGRKTSLQVAGSAQAGEEDARKRRRFEEAFIASLGGGQR